MSILVDCPHCSTRVLPLAGRVCPACRQDVDIPPDPATKSDRVVAAAYEKVQHQILAGHDPLRVAQVLTQQGLDPIDAAKVLSKLEANRSEMIRDAGRSEMVVGGVSCLVGLVITVVSIGLASSLGGGLIVVAWGAIFFGGFQFVRGLLRSTGGDG